MSDLVFQWVPSLGTEVQESYTLRKAQLGDGYVQIAQQGINAVKETYPLVFENITKARADEIRAFLRDHAGQSFLWETPDGVIKRFRCDEGPRYRFVSGNIGTLSCTFIETFNP
jgi:phage-related protein